ncbi:MAG: hemolysin family protein [Fimbriimonadaceae bacterium]
MESDKRRLQEKKLMQVQRGLSGFMGALLLGLALAGEASRIGSTQMAATFPSVPGGAYVLVLFLVIVILVNGCFVSAETAVALLRPMHIRHLKEKGERRGTLLEKLLDNQSNASAACSLGSELCGLALALLVFLLAPGFTAFLSQWTHWDETSYANVGLSAIVLWLFPFNLLKLLVAQAFRGYAIIHPHGIALRLYGFIQVTSLILSVPARWTTVFAKLVASRSGKMATPMANQAENEIRTLVESAEESGEIESDERELLHSVFEFADTVAREVMTPRVDMDALDVNSNPHEVMAVIQESGHSRIPLYEGTDDQIVGIIHAKDLLLAMIKNGGDPDLRQLMRAPHFVPENKPLNELLSEMKQSRSQMAVVSDEYGGTAGVVTIEDIVEELVGDIVDEYDNEMPEIEPSGSGWSVDGRMHIDDLNEAIGTEFESEEFDTVGGFVFGHFGRQPRLEESIDIDGCRFVVTNTDGRRVNRIFVEAIKE